MWDAALLPSLEAELARATPGDLAAIPDALLADMEGWAEPSREELWVGLQRLQTWIQATRADEPVETEAVARDGNALVVLMDGDQ
ncbi:MAG: hypothetical protein HOO96_29985 [Polyangiaceae bacterium]|nr:hypothetical protein [Polyangiaceae bacterium]